MPAPLTREEALAACEARIRAAAQECAERMKDRTASAYVRERDLPKLSPRSVEWAEDEIIPKLECAMRAEQNRARKGHPTFDLNRTVAIRAALDSEKRRAA